jgi:hypothetical protein
MTNMPQSKTVRVLLRSASLLSLGACLALTSCSNKATEEQMKMLGDLDRQREGLRSDLDRAQLNLRDAKTRLANQERDLADCRTETQSVRDGLSRWPNVWIDSVDWRVAPPPAPEPVVTKKKRRK